MTTKPPETPKRKNFKNRNLFDYLRNILKDKDLGLYRRHLEIENFEEDFKKFMVLRYLSMCRDPNVRKIIFERQLSLDRMSSKTAYLYLLRNVPRQTDHFIKYLG